MKQTLTLITEHDDGTFSALVGTDVTLVQEKHVHTPGQTIKHGFHVKEYVDGEFSHIECSLEIRPHYVEIYNQPSAALAIHYANQHLAQMAGKPV